MNAKNNAETLPLPEQSGFRRGYETLQGCSCIQTFYCSKPKPIESKTDMKTFEKTYMTTQRQGQLKRDGKVVLDGTECEAMAYIHRNHCYSYSHALAHEGFSYDTAEEISIRKAMQS